MIDVYHLNCVKIVSPLMNNVSGHCLLLKDQNNLALIDTGIGLLDTINPNERLGREAIEMVGYQFYEEMTAIRQIAKLGFQPENVTDCVISHLDYDHIGGLPDFPKATVHLSREELENYNSGNPRYSKQPFEHHPVIHTYGKSRLEWYGFEARKIILKLECELYLIPLFGHTLGHCGIALKHKNKWLFYIGDAYYLKIELETEFHPVKELTKMRADDNIKRIETLNKIRKLTKEHPEIEIFGYHDITEFPKVPETISQHLYG